MEKKPKEPGGCCLFQMIFVLLLTILAYTLYTNIWPHLRHKIPDTIDLAFSANDRVEERGPLAYGNHEDRKLYIYRSEDAPEDGLLPVLVFIHGGGWADGDPADYGYVGRNFAPKGFVVVNIGYRLLPDGKYPAMLVDSAAAIKWTSENISKYGGDPERIIVMGHSAGAYNAVMLGMDRRWTRRIGLPDDTIDGIIGLAGPYDFYPFDSDNAKEAFGAVRPPKVTQPIEWKRRNTPPMLLMTGSEDETVEPDETRALVRSLAERGSPVRGKAFEGMGHSGILMALGRPFDMEYIGEPAVKDEITTFLTERLRDAARARTRAERQAREAAATRDANSPPEPVATGTEGEEAQASGDIQPADR